MPQPAKPSSQVHRLESQTEKSSSSSLSTPQPITARFLHRTSNPSLRRDFSVPSPQDKDEEVQSSASRLLSTFLPASDAFESPPVDDPEAPHPSSSSQSRTRKASTPRSTLSSTLAPSRASRSHTSYLPLEDLSQAPAPTHKIPIPLTPLRYDPLSAADQIKPISHAAPHHHGMNMLPPVAATTLFATDAAPLLLPEVDEYLERLPAPPFTMPSPSSPSTSKPFPPLELVRQTTIQDLKSNRSPVPFWKNRNTWFGVITSWVLGLTGSSVVATFYSLQGIYDSVQVFALVLTSAVRITDARTVNSWRQLFLGTVPNVLALNVSVLTQSVVFFIVFQICTLSLVAYFHRSTTRFVRTQPMHEGLLEKPESTKGQGWPVLVVSFVLISLYLPISTMTLHALVWTDDFWPVPNPYLNSTGSLLLLAPDPSGEFRDPLDFCWTTTMRKDSLNWAPLLIVISLISFFSITVYFPVRLWLSTKQCLPIVDPFTEMGRRRNVSELEHEYQRILDRDTNPMSFLYNEFRRRWGSYKAIYLVIKLVALLTVALIDPNNCLFRGSSRDRIDVIRQSVLLAETLAALVLQSTLAPFIDPTSNASEWTSRAGYVATSLVGLLVALKVKGSTVINGPVLYVIYFLNYGLNIYFAIVGTSWIRLLIKKYLRRLDFSVDIFSPLLDISPASIHTRRRIYQEAVSVMLLATPTCKMPTSQNMVYSEAPSSQWSPYLMDFSGTPAERHAENLKILRDVGIEAYYQGVDLRHGVQRKQFRELQRQIEKGCVGPDAFWCPDEVASHSCSRYFGHAWWIPFPPRIVMRYDHGGTVCISSLADLSTFAAQNRAPSIVEKRSIRLALRALDHQVVTWPYIHTELVGAKAWRPFGGQRFKAQIKTPYRTCTFDIKRNGVASFDGLSLGSGFTIQMRYSGEILLDGSIIGLDNDFTMTPQLARFLLFNRLLISERSSFITETLQNYRLHMRRMAQWKRDVLSYRFLTEVYTQPMDSDSICDVVRAIEVDPRVQHVAESRRDAFDATHERLKAVSRSPATTWWFLLWDDMWRQNYQAFSAMRTHAFDFDTHFPTSIAYRPVPRPVLEAFLSQRGLLRSSGGFIHPGFLNKVYIRLSQIIFSGSSKIIRAHIGGQSTELDISELQLAPHARSSTLGTGGGTDHDDDEIRARLNYRWEGIYDDSIQRGRRGTRLRLRNHLAVWFGITPLRKHALKTNGVSFDVALVGKHYVTLQEEDE